ncbi:MAG: hypothetical protein CMJ89_11110 [Planctomycetes bacterium]|nr:hypothetical protein [Planctomycetota bacterium]
MVVFFALASCTGGGGGVGQVGVPGEFQTDSSGHLFFVDPHMGGRGESLRLVDMLWGRLVDVHDVDVDGTPNQQPLIRDLVINQNVVTDGEYTLETNPITRRTRLVIHEPHDPSLPNDGAFLSLLRDATANLAPILPKNDDGSSSPPFSLVARNACIVLRFNDLMEDSADAALGISERVRLGTGTPPDTPFGSRILFGPNHGGSVGGRFHSTRILIDLTVSEAEAVASPVPIVTNTLGLPASPLNSTSPSAAVRLPTQVSPGDGQFHILQTLFGAGLTGLNAGPIDPTSPTRDLVRAFRAGNAADINNGFLLDLEPPRIVGQWPIRLTEVRPRKGDRSGLAFQANLTFLGPCTKAPLRGEVLTVGFHFLSVAANAAAPDGNGVVANVELGLLGVESIASPDLLVGDGFFRPIYRPGGSVPGACWLTFSPDPRTPPDRNLSSSMQASLRFTEPMDPASVTPLETFQMVRGISGTQVEPKNVVIGTVSSSGDLQEFRFTPLLPLSHSQNGEFYHFRLLAMTDLSNNVLAQVPASISITVDPEEPVIDTGGLALFFDSPNEIDPATSGNDLRGQFFYDLEKGSIRPRPVFFASAAADRINPVPSIMVPFAPGVQTPLSPLGSKMQMVWRYTDFGWQVLDETLYNLDVVGLSWSPIGGLVTADFYENFEIRLAHSSRLTHECRGVATGFPLFGDSGLHPGLFVNNILTGEGIGQEIVHPAPLGYQVNPSDRFTSAAGTPMMPFPWNRNAGNPNSYTWRDTRSPLVGGDDGPGLPICIEIGAPLLLESPPNGRIRRAGNVPTFGLPLLLEFRCFPSSSGLGLNAFDISLANNASRGPIFRTFSTGGINRFGNPVQVQPDLEDQARGGFNPNSSPPGRRTPPEDNSFYVGQLDYVIRMSQLHSIWLDLRPGPIGPFQWTNFAQPVVFPPAQAQPSGTSVVLEYRGASGFADVGESAFDARFLDPYGNIFEFQTTDEHNCNQCIRERGTVFYHGGVETWSEDIDALDGSSFIQVRMTFFNDIGSGQTAHLDSFGIAVAYE